MNAIININFYIYRALDVSVQTSDCYGELNRSSHMNVILFVFFADWIR